MKLDVAVNDVVLSNVGSTGEFRIRNSAKAFKILSDGLYSNKIRAVIRELSCNAVDSHVAAGNTSTPFEVHLPTVLEPWFAVKDFGIGLSSHQVTSIYTTYFESTKTESNDFIGALGLGSKSPFSYTDNFTISAVKAGTKCIYSAYINDVGVPSVAEMSKELTDEPNGVEVKFSVTDRNDYNSFRHESQEVFKWFTNTPTFTGHSDFVVQPVTYGEQNIVPGVHICAHNHYHQNYSIAVMGNIAYPLNKIPEPVKYFGALASLLECGLTIEFGIGELDFAASREELSYVAITIASIKRKLEELNANLASHIATKADAIKCMWARAEFLSNQISANQQLYKAAVIKYVTDTKFPLYNPTAYHGTKVFELLVPDLAKRELSIIGTSFRHGRSSAIGYSQTTIAGSGSVKVVNISVATDCVIVLNDLKIGCASRSRYHYNNAGGICNVFNVSHLSKDLTVRQAAYDKLLAELHNPPTVIMASMLEKKPSTAPTSTQGIMRITRKAKRSSYGPDEYMWSPEESPIDDDETYYYVALSNYEAQSSNGKPFDAMAVKQLMVKCGISDISGIVVHGVRKSRLKEISELDNWVDLEDKLREETAKVSDASIIGMVVSDIVDHYTETVYTNAKIAAYVDVASDYRKYSDKYRAIKRGTGNVSQLTALCSMYGKSLQVEQLKYEINTERTELQNKYPLLRYLNGADVNKVAEYIKLVDKS